MAFLPLIGALAGIAGAGVGIANALDKPPAPPKIPEAPKPPDIRSIDRVNTERAGARSGGQTILGGFAGGDAQVSRPTLLGGS